MSTPGNDPVLASDKCMFLEVVKDDAGQNKGSNPNWWNSWDFSIIDPSNSQDVTGQALLNGHTYTVNVRLHIAPGSDAQSCPSPNTAFVQAEVYLCFPFAATTPTNSLTQLLTKTQVLPTDFQTDPTITKSKVHTISVNHVFQLDPTQPTDDGHRCLVARCFQFGDITSTTPSDFFIPDDQHYGQHNLSITVPPAGGRMMKFPIMTVNGNLREEAPVTLRVIADLQPHEQLLELLLPRLKRIDGFKEVATTPLKQGFALNLPDFPDVRIQQQFDIRGALTGDHPREGGRLGAVGRQQVGQLGQEIAEQRQQTLAEHHQLPGIEQNQQTLAEHIQQPVVEHIQQPVIAETQQALQAQGRHFEGGRERDGEHHEQPFYEAMFQMKPGQQTTFFFQVDTSSDPVGTARIYHVTHADAQQRVIGGLTIVTVKP